jgi:putative peptide maturation dehydrogenase
MKLHRPAHVRFEYREGPDDRLRALLSAGATGPAGSWVATAAHLDAEVDVTAAELQAYAAIPEHGIDSADFGGDAAVVAKLLACGLLLSDGPASAAHSARDAALRATGWWGPAALLQRLSRWDGVDVAAMEAQEGKRGIARLLQEQGRPPTESFRARRPADAIALPEPAAGALDELFAGRATCRNFDASSVPLADLAQVLHRVFGVHGSQELAPGAVMLKKNSPSGGGLHPVEAFVLAQRVDGIAPGLYHYQCVDHALEPMRPLREAEAATLAHELVAGQPWFANAPVLVLMAARFDRSFWKYPDHAKAWKVIQLDAGHLSQNFYLSATERGYGAFVTAAINDACAERCFELDGTTIGAVAVCGFGRRAANGDNVELDPLGKAVR